MFSRIERSWRILTTGMSFVVFGIGGLVLRTLVFPVLSVLIWEEQLRIAVVRRVIRLGFRAFIEMMRFFGVLEYDIKGLDRLERKGLLILANHPTLLDTVFLMAFVKDADCIVKSSLRDNPFTRGPVAAAGFICNDSGVGLVDACIDSLRAGSNLIIFPEGTRTSRTGSVSLKRGAANIAARGLCNVTPVMIQCAPHSLGKGDKWWHVPERRVHFRIEVRQDIEVQEFLDRSGSEVLAARHLTDYLQNYFSKENTNHAVA